LKSSIRAQATELAKVKGTVDLNLEKVVSSWMEVVNK